MNLDSARHPIQVVARRTGLSAEVLRVWEKRYGAVRPSRTSTGRRLYSDADLERLALLRQATGVGRRIGDVGGLPTEELRALVDEDRRATASFPTGDTPRPPAASKAEALAEESVQAILALDEERLEATLGRALLVLRAPEVIEEVVAPTLRRIGHLWSSGTLEPSHEHVATVVIRRVIGHAIASVRVGDGAPRLAAATPRGQVHDLGALLAGLMAAASGWRVVVLGADLPAADIARAARQKNVRAVALSLVHPTDDPGLPDELHRLRQLLPDDIVLLAGGAALHRYTPALREVRAVVLPDFRSLGPVLDAIRHRGSGARGQRRNGRAE